MKPYSFTAKSPLLEEYVVKFWKTSKATGYKQQEEMSIYFASKGRHRDAEIVCMRKQNIKNIDIISCNYQ